MDTKEILKLKDKLFLEDEIADFLINITKELLASNLKEKTISPLEITHKEFIDTSLKKLIKSLKSNLIFIAKKRKIFIDDKIFDLKLDYLSAYILKYDMEHNMYIHKTIAKYILKTIRKSPLKLNNFVSTLNKEIYQGKFAKFRYPVLYPFDKNRYNNPIPELKAILNKIDTVNKSLIQKESRLKILKQKYEKVKLEIEQIKIASIDMNDIVNILKEKYNGIEQKNRLRMIKNQHSRFSVLLTELKNNMIEYKQEINSLTKNINGIKEKYKDILQKEDEIVEVIANNLKKMKEKI